MDHAEVLVIDNVDEIVEELLTLMELHDVAARGASDLDEAIQILEAEPTIRAVSCDLRLDRESGLEILDRVRAHPALRTRKLRYLFVTGDKLQMSAISGAGDHAVMSKPVQPNVLMDAVRGMLAEQGA